MGVSNRACTGHHAKAALTKVFSTCSTPRAVAEALDREGYIIVPKPYQKPARRGNDVKPDPWIGKSHTANLIGG